MGTNGETTSVITLYTRTGELTADGWYTLGGTHLLAGSGIPGYDDDFGYIPGIGNDRNHLA